ncbi:hypothetical protein VTL71DRAFT_4034 [Oculimacula yallundae]|uniref:Uncharacterized protein n=1 Tax=Oculimacula yallundae TaxID=86028 RepID=A0ABR4C6J3_9HELO
MADRRNFEEINVGNFHGQKGRQRALGDGNRERPRITHWRNNLTALSHDFDLYFAAYGDKIHITKPLDLHQTLPILPDLVLDLPSSSEAFSVGGSISQAHPHDVNNIKVGKLGDFEILLIACDDGDLLAFYTRLLKRDVQVVGPVCNEDPTSHIKPFFHENVGKSAWGLSIHQISRLIAVGTNLREVTVFAFAVNYHADTDSHVHRDLTGFEGPEDHVLSSESPFVTVTELDFRPHDLGYSERKNCRLRLPLGPSGSNIPSIDFVSDKDGEASVVLATDVFGKLWSLDLTKHETHEWPEIHQEASHIINPDVDFEPRGWGVLCIPTSCFMTVQSPQEALGIKKLQSALKLKTVSSALCFQSLDISSSIATVGNSSVIHPSCSNFINPPPPPPNTLTLESIPTPPPLRPGPPWDVVRWCVGGYLHDFERMKCMVQQPNKIPGYQSDNWAKAMSTRLLSEDWYSEAVGQWLDETYHNVEVEWNGGFEFQEAIKVLKYFLILIPEVRYKYSTWRGVQQAMTKEIERDGFSDLLSPKQWMSIAQKSQAVPRLQEGNMAIIRTSAKDIELIPPHPNMLSTICRNFLQQTLPNQHTQEFLDRFDRLNMFAVIPELSLLVVASQKGRVGLFTLTRLDDEFADVAPVLMMRLDCVLPLTTHEKEYRPNAPLLGMAVGPLQGKDQDGGVQRKIWRLMLHYMDHTVLSYELRRGSGLEGLGIF